MNLVGQIRFWRDPAGRVRAEVPPERAVLADFLETDVGDDPEYVLEKLDQAEAGDEVTLSLNACYVQADRAGVRIEHLHREHEGMQCALALGELRSLLIAWASFRRTP